MSVQNIIAPATNLAEANLPQELNAIHQPDKNIAIWKRANPLKDIQTRELLQRLETPFSASGTANDAIASLKNYCAPIGIAADALQADIKHLLQVFATVTQASSFKVLLSVVNTNMCRKFHTDINDLRLLCTYYGPGTLWLAEPAAGGTNCLDQPTLDEAAHQVAAGHVALLKGALYPTGQAGACVHRSPTVEETGEKRLLLRIDNNDFLSFLEAL